MKKKTLIRFVTVIAMVALVFTLTGCVGKNQDDLRGTSWLLKEMNGVPLMSGTTLTIEFTDDQISGSAGCNHFGADYEMYGSKLNFNSLYNTEMYCMEPKGIMDQEQVYLESLRTVDEFSLTEGELIVFGAGDLYLTFLPYDLNAVSSTPADQNNIVQAETPTEVLDNQTLSNSIPPWEYHRYQDSKTGIGLFIPETWIVTGIVDVDHAVLQSYPEDKYVGGESREEGDTKCDLSIQSAEIGLEELVNQWKSSSMTTILSEQQINLDSGQVGLRLEIESLGPSISFVTELGGYVVVLTCFGNFSLADEIAVTLNYLE